ncbi:MAG: signal peptidase I [Polyangiaceae bacterium]|nr:signal peptidase I [Polyangiaceae bacterium]
MRKFLKGLAWVAGVIAVIVIVARIFFVKPWRIPDDAPLNASIAPTLESGDLVLVLFSGTREAGDLVRCAHPEEPTRWIVGRIHGNGGDKVMVEGQFATINGRKYRTTEACLHDHYDVVAPGGVKKTLSCNRVDFGGGWHYILWQAGSEVSPSNETLVGPDRYYLVSDNRTDSWDSRDYGTVPANTCTDKVLFRLWGKGGFFDSDRRFEYLR